MGNRADTSDTSDPSDRRPAGDWAAVGTRPAGSETASAPPQGRRASALEAELRKAHPAAWYALPDVVFHGGNDVQLLRGGAALFPAMCRAIDTAVHEVWVATYIFHDDAAGQSTRRALVAASRRGVRVRVVVDGFGSSRTIPVLRSWFEGTGVALAVFRPLERWWRWQPDQLRRLHQKICVVDGTVAFVGGINVLDDYNDLTHGRGDTPRLDFALQVRGPVATPIEQTARAMWTRAAFGADWRTEVNTMARSAQPFAAARALMRRLRIRPGAATLRQGSEDLRPVRAAFVVRDNLRQRRAIERTLVDAIRASTTQVDLVTPYFYPGRGFRRVLVKAARRGVRVRLLLQGKLDYRLAGLAASVLYDGLLAEGVQIHEYMPAFLHAKMAIVDDDWMTVGSSNVDPLSLLLNLEANVVVHDAQTAAEARRQVDEAIVHSRQIHTAPYRTGLLARLRRGFVAWVAHWYLRMAGVSKRY